MGLDSYGSTPFGQRRSQATLWPDSLRLLQVPCASILRKQNKKAFGSLESFCWCGRWDWILTARRRSVSAALRPHCGLIHYGFFKSHALRFFVSKTKKPSVLSKAFAGAADETESEPEAPASVTCPSMDFTRWSSEE